MHAPSSSSVIHRVRRSLRLACGPAVALLLTLIASPLALAAGYYAQNGKLFDPASQEIQIRGISHFGFNAEILQPQHLWEMGWKAQIAQIKSLGFNAIRLPFVPETLYSTQTVDSLSYIDPGKNPELFGKTPLEVLDLWMAEANRQGLYIMLDFHSVTKRRLYPTWFVDNPADYFLTYDGQAYTEDDWVRDLKFVAARYAALPYFFAIDLYNEPNGSVRWSTGDANVTNPKFFWKRAAEKAAAGVLQTNPNLLIFVQGINGNYDGIEDSNIPMNWGESFQQQAYQPLDIPYDKLVLTPHTYGPDVYVKTTFSAPNYPANLAADWHTLFGRFHPQHPVVVSEWGGRYGEGGVGEADVVWQNAFVDYLLSQGIRSSFYWCYTPNSGDTGGILDDNLNVREDKMALLRRHWGDGPISPTPLPTLLPTATPMPTPAPTTAPTVTVTPTVTPTATPAPTVAPPAAMSVAMVNGSISVDQAAGTVKISVQRNGNANRKVTVSYATLNGTAVAGRDYTARSGTLTWTKGDATAKTISVAIRNATAFSGSRQFSLALSNPSSGLSLSTPSVSQITINGRATPTLQAPYIQSFSPTSGAVGTVVTVNGHGFTGTTAAWAGAAKNAGFTVVSDSQIQVTIPPGATSGAIGILNPLGASFTASAFTVSTVSTALPQPYIQSFSPASGAVGSAVTFTGNGFTGLNNAWVGNSRAAVVTVISDTQAQVIIPADATSGSVGLFNPSKVAFSATALTVQR